MPSDVSSGAPESGSASTGSGDLLGAINGILDSVPSVSEPSVSTPEASDAEPDKAIEAEPEQETPAEEAKPEVTPEVTPEAQPEQPQDDVDPEDRPDRVTTYNGKKWHYFTPERSAQLQERAKVGRAFQQIADTPEQAAEFRDAYTDLLAFKTGDAESVVGLLNKLATEAPDSMRYAEAEIVGHVLNNPQHIHHLGARDIVLQRLESEFAQRFRSDPQGPDADAYKFLAQGLEAFRTGKFSELVPGAVPNSDPLDARNQALAQREQEINRFYQEREQKALQSWQGNVRSSISTSVNGLIEKALEPIAAAKQSHPTLYDAAANALRKAASQAIDADKAWKNIFDSKCRLAEKSYHANPDKARDDIRSMYEAKVRKALSPSAVAKVISEFSSVVTTQSKENHQRLAKGESKKEVAGAGAAPKARVSNPAYEKAKQDKDITAAVKALMGL